MGTRKILNEFVIPKCTGKGFIVKKGEVLRIIDHAGPQVADVIFLKRASLQRAIFSEMVGILEQYRGHRGIQED